MKYRMMDLKILTIDKRYQRELDQLFVERIVQNFDPRLLGVLEVSVRNGKAAVFDGQHRLAALKRLKQDKAPCMAHEGLSPEEESRLFVELQRRRRNINALDRFRARVFSGEPAARDIKATVERCGYTIAQWSGPQQGERHEIRAIGTLDAIYKKAGTDGLEATLLLLDIWRGDPKSTDGVLIHGSFRLCRGYGDRLDQLARQRLAEASPTVILRRALGAPGTVGGGAAVGGNAVYAELRKIAGVRGRPMKHKKAAA